MPNFPQIETSTEGIEQSTLAGILDSFMSVRIKGKAGLFKRFLTASGLVAVTLPASTIYGFYVRNLDSQHTVQIQWTPATQGNISVLALPPGGFCCFGINMVNAPDSGLPNFIGISGLNLNNLGATAALVEVLLVG